MERSVCQPTPGSELSGAAIDVVVTCEHDPLRDQGEQYAARTEHVGMPTVLRREPGLVHGFLQWDSDSLACAGAADRVALDVRTALLA